MKNLIIILLALFLTGCKTTYVYNEDEGPGTYNSYYDNTQTVYYWNNLPYYGYWDGYYYYYGYPHIHPWHYYYSYQPPCWYRPYLHVHHNVVYVFPVNGWKYNNRRGGQYLVPERHRNNIQNSPRPHVHDGPRENRVNDNPSPVIDRRDYRKEPATIQKPKPTYTPRNNNPKPNSPERVIKQPANTPSRERSPRK